MTNGGDFAFLDIELYRDPVTRQRLSRSLNPCAIAPLRNIGPKNLELQPFQRGTLENLTFLQSGTVQRLLQHIRLDGFVALDIDRADGGALLYRQNQHVIVTTGTQICK